MLYKIYECEVQTTKTGKELKKLVLKADDQENTEPRVTLWDNHPEYENAKVGGTINGTLDKKDSGIPIPAHPEKNYVNRTLLPESNENGTLKVDAPDIASRLAYLETWAMSQGYELKTKDSEDVISDSTPF